MPYFASPGSIKIYATATRIFAVITINAENKTAPVIIGIQVQNRINCQASDLWPGEGFFCGVQDDAKFMKELTKHLDLEVGETIHELSKFVILANPRMGKAEI